MPIHKFLSQFVGECAFLTGLTRKHDKIPFEDVTELELDTPCVERDDVQSSVLRN